MWKNKKPPLPKKNEHSYCVAVLHTEIQQSNLLFCMHYIIVAALGQNDDLLNSAIENQ